MRRRFVSQPARSEMYSYPDAVFLIRKNIDVMISSADRAELISRHFSYSSNGQDLPCLVFEQLMIHPRFGFSSDPERNISHDIVHNGFDPWADVAAFCVG